MPRHHRGDCERFVSQGKNGVRHPDPPKSTHRRPSALFHHGNHRAGVFAPTRFPTRFGGPFCPVSISPRHPTPHRTVLVTKFVMSGSVTRAPALVCDRGELSTGIVHFGVGGFHRSHQQVRVCPILCAKNVGRPFSEPRGDVSEVLLRAIHRMKRVPNVTTGLGRANSGVSTRRPWFSHPHNPILSRSSPPRNSPLTFALNSLAFLLVLSFQPQAYLDELLRVDFENTKSWCYTGLGVLSFDTKMRDYLVANKFTYPVVSRTGETPETMAMHVHHVVTLRDMLLSFENPAAAVRLLSSPDVKIVSLTITEFGYRVPINEGDRTLVKLALDGAVDGAHNDEATPAECAGATVFGILLAALANRKRHGLRPFTIMSCDNLPHNGEVAKRRVLGAAADLDLDPATQQWLETEAKYPSTMVDRITPATSNEDIVSLKENADITDAWPVMCEPYKHWVIEDDFVDGARPAWETVGALLVPDVRPHELMKVRLLNVGHSAMCYAGVLAGCEHVHEAVTHKMIKPFLKRLMREEIAASLVADPSMEALVCGLDQYAELVLSRFKNVAVKDTLDRIAMDGSEKFRVQGRAVVMEGLAADRTVRGFALYVAAWAHFLRKAVMEGSVVRDASASLIVAPWADVAGVGPVESAVTATEYAVPARLPPQTAEDAAALQRFLDIEEVFGVLAQHEGWRQAVVREFEDIATSGVEATLLGYIFGVGHNSNGDLAQLGSNGARLSERVSGTFILDEVCAHEDAAAAPDITDEAVAFVSLY